MKKIIKIVIISIVLGISCAVAYYLISVSPISSEDKKIIIDIPSKSTSTKIGQILTENKVIRNKFIFKLYIKLNNVNNLQAGKYCLNTNMSLSEIVKQIKEGNIYKGDELSITYLEGKTIRWLANKISEVTNNSKESVFEQLEDEEYLNYLINKYWFITDNIKNENIYYSLEGYLFPDTYILKNKDVSVKEIFEIFLNQTDKILSEYKEQIENSNYSVHEILTISSIIETECMNDSDRKNVSSVIYNRLQNNIAIQSDVTTYYSIKVDVGERDLYQSEINKYNPYNTRGPNMEGKLPIGPIASVGKASIEAAINPNSTDYLFFVADKNGKVYFTKTNGEHDSKIQELKNSGKWYEWE